MPTPREVVTKLLAGFLTNLSKRRERDTAKRQIAHCENARHDVFLFAVTGVPKKGIRFRMAEAKGRSKQTAAP
jgi:hypothetical protein